MSHESACQLTQYSRWTFSSPLRFPWLPAAPLRLPPPRTQREPQPASHPPWPCGSSPRQLEWQRAAHTRPAEGMSARAGSPERCRGGGPHHHALLRYLERISGSLLARQVSTGQGLGQEGVCLWVPLKGSDARWQPNKLLPANMRKASLITTCLSNPALPPPSPTRGR